MKHQRRLYLTILLGWTLLFGAGTLHAWSTSCSGLCSAMAPLQSYGTGDSACLAACQGAASACQTSWDVYFQCVDAGNELEACWPAFAAARSCSICELGEVDLEGTSGAVFVNNQHYVDGELVCSEEAEEGGTAGLPYCDFGLGVKEALERHVNGDSTKVVVCPGTYYESHDDPAAGLAGPTTSAARVIVESVARDQAVISGSEPWTGAWLPVAHQVNEIHHNELLQSVDPAISPWGYPDLTHDPLVTWAAPTGDPGFVRHFAAGSASASQVLAQAVPAFGARRVTLSVYLYPDGVDRFQLNLLHDQDGNPATVGHKNGAWYEFELPPSPAGAPCAFESSSSDATGRIEQVGSSGWYRVSLTRTFDTVPDPNTNYLPMVSGVRLFLLDPDGEMVWAGDEEAGVFVYGPQLDHRPLDEFGTEARSYVWTAGSTDSQPATVVKNLWVNDPSVKTWPHDWGLAYIPSWGRLSPIVRRSEMVFVDGVKLRQELSFADLRPGSFFVDDGISYATTNYPLDESMIPGSCSASQPCSIYIEPPAGTNMAVATVEVARSPRLLWLNPVRDWEFRGLLFRHATGAHDQASGGAGLQVRQSAAVIFNNASRLTLLENRFEWNSAFGLAVNGTVDRTQAVSQDSNVRMIGNAVRHNGIAGFFLGGCQRCDVIGDEYSHNNWSGAQGGFMGHTTAGAKYAANIDTIVRGLVASHNHGHGLWLDYENQQMQVLESTFEKNVGNGLYFEANDEWCSPVANTTNYVIDCAFTGNNVGIRLIGSRGTRMSLNQISDNRTALSMIGNPYVAVDKTCYPPNGDDTPLKWLRDVWFDNNVINATCPGDLWIDYGDNAGNWSRWQPVMESLYSGENTYSHVEGPGTKAIRLVTQLLTFKDWADCDPSLPFPPAWCFRSQEEGSSEQ